MGSRCYSAYAVGKYFVEGHGGVVCVVMILVYLVFMKGMRLKAMALKGAGRGWIFYCADVRQASLSLQQLSAGPTGAVFKNNAFGVNKKSLRYG